MGRVVPEIDAAQLPDELLDIEVVPEVPQIGGALNEFDQKAAPLAFHLKNLLSDHALDVVELEEPCRDGTAPRQSGSPSPSEPIANELSQAGQAVARRHRRVDHTRPGELRHVRQQFNLDGLLGAEVSEESALRHPDLIRKDTECDARQPGLARERQPAIEYPLARRENRIRHLAR